MIDKAETRDHLQERLNSELGDWGYFEVTAYDKIVEVMGWQRQGKLRIGPATVLYDQIEDVGQKEMANVMTEQIQELIEDV